MPHYGISIVICSKVRQTIQELGGTMPEDLPPAESIRKLEAQQRKALKSGKKQSP